MKKWFAVFFSFTILLAVFYFYANRYAPWLIYNYKEMSYEQILYSLEHSPKKMGFMSHDEILETIERFKGDGMLIKIDKEEYFSGDSILLTVKNNSNVNLNYWPDDAWGFKVGIENTNIKLLNQKKEFLILPDETKNLQLKIPNTLKPGKYIIKVWYGYPDWIPAGYDLFIEGNKVAVKILVPSYNLLKTNYNKE